MENKKWIDPQIGYVIEIPDSTSIIVNVGEDSISLGEKLVIYEEGPEVKDSKTNEVLGRKDYIKDILEVTEVYENFSVCRKVTKKKMNKINYSMASLLENKEYVEHDLLYVNESQIKHWEIKNDRISINDPVKMY